jgi:hypothetical protein
VLDLDPEDDVAGACALDGFKVMAAWIEEYLRVARG